MSKESNSEFKVQAGMLGDPCWLPRSGYLVQLTCPTDYNDGGNWAQGCGWLICDNRSHPGDVWLLVSPPIFEVSLPLFEARGSIVPQSRNREQADTGQNKLSPISLISSSLSISEIQRKLWLRLEFPHQEDNSDAMALRWDPASGASRE